MYYVYMLRCRDGSLYSGITTDLTRRVKVHNSGKGAKYTRSRLPVSLAYYEEAEDKSQALKREIQLKKLHHGQKEALVEEFLRNGSNNP